MTAHGSFGLNEAFDPDMTRLLASAFESALSALDASDAEQFSAHSIRQILAKSIIDEALGGERDVAQLAERALAHLRAQSNPSDGSVPRTNRRPGHQALEDGHSHPTFTV